MRKTGFTNLATGASVIAICAALICQAQAAGSSNRAPRMSEITEAACSKIGFDYVEVCMKWQTAAHSTTKAATCVETKRLCSPPTQ